MNFITCYNSYMWPSLITDADEKMMVSQGLRKFFIEGGAYGTEWPLVMAGSTLIVLPLLILLHLRKSGLSMESAEIRV